MNALYIGIHIFIYVNLALLIYDSGKSRESKNVLEVSPRLGAMEAKTKEKRAILERFLADFDETW